MNQVPTTLTDDVTKIPQSPLAHLSFQNCVNRGNNGRNKIASSALKQKSQPGKGSYGNSGSNMLYG